MQALLRVLAAGRDVAETARSVVTVELDPERAALARERLRDLSNVELLEGDARAMLAGRGPFGLVFADGGGTFRSAASREAVLALVEPGGILVKDDMTPGRAAEGDEVREFLLRDPRLAATEVLATPDMAVIVAVRLR